MSGARAILLVTWREIKERGKSRAYLFSSLFTIAIMIAIIVVPAAVEGGGEVVYEIGVVGDGNDPLLAAAEEIARQRSVDDADNDFRLETTSFDSLTAAEVSLAEGDVEILLADGEQLVTTGTGGFIAGGSGAGSLLQAAARSVRIAGLVEERQLGEDDVAELLTGQFLTSRTLSGQEADDPSRELVAYFGMMLTYIAILTYGAWTLTGVTEEKANKVVEVLLATVKPRHLLAGKVFGIGVLAFAQFFITVAMGAAAVALTDIIALPAVPVSIILSLVFWFLMGFGLYATAFGAVGALVSRMEEAQTAALPISLVAIGSLFATFTALTDPTSVAAAVVTYIPLTAPFVVPVRFALDALAWWEFAGAALVTGAAMWLLIRFAGRVYAGAILRTGGRIKLRDAYRTAEM